MLKSTKVSSVRLPKELDTALDKASETEYMSRSSIIRRALARYLKELEKERGF